MATASPWGDPTPSAFSRADGLDVQSRLNQQLTGNRRLARTQNFATRTASMRSTIHDFIGTEHVREIKRDAGIRKASLLEHEQSNRAVRALGYTSAVRSARIQC